MSFSDANSPIVYFTTQQEQLKTVLLERLIQVADYEIARASEQKDKKYLPSTVDYRLDIAFMTDVLLPHDAPVQMHFEYSFQRGARDFFGPNHPGRASILEVVMGSSLFEFLQKGAHAFVLQCVRSIRAEMQERYPDICFIYTEHYETQHSSPDVFGICLHMNIKVREQSSQEEWIAVNAVVM